MSERKPGATRVGGGREAVLSAALQNFYKYGYHGTSMRNIATDADMTVASIYHHFESKQEILQEIMVRILSDLMSHTRTVVMAADDTPRGQLEALVFAWIVFHANRQTEAFVGSTEVRSLDPEGRRLVVALRDEQERMLTSAEPQLGPHVQRRGVHAALLVSEGERREAPLQALDRVEERRRVVAPLEQR